MNTDGQLSLAPEVSVHSTDLVKTGVQEVEGKSENDSDCFQFHERAMPVFC
jgi:hypothetical protein